MTSARWRVVLWITMLGIVFYIAWQAVGALLPFAVGAVLAYALSPLVDRISVVVPARSHQGDVYRRGFAVLLIYWVIGSLLFVLGSQVIPLLVDQVAEFVDTLPSNLTAAQQRVNEWAEVYRNRVPLDVQNRVDTGVDEALATAAAAARTLAQRTVSVITGTIGIVFGFAIVPFWMFYAMRDRHYASNNFLNAVPESLQADAGNLLQIADRLVGRYIRAQLFLGLVVGTAVGVSLTLLNVQMSLALGLFAGITELVPIVGPWIGAIPGVVIVAATAPDKLIWVAGVYFIVQQVENIFLVPRIQGHALEMHPAMILILLAAGGAAFGMIGLLIIVPTAALAREVFWYLDRRLRGEDPALALASSHVVRASHHATDAVAPVPLNASPPVAIESAEATHPTMEPVEAISADVTDEDEEADEAQAEIAR